MLDIVFDLLFVNDKSILGLTLKQRFTLLQRCIKPKEKQVEIVQQKPVKSVEDIIDALDIAIMNRFVELVLFFLCSSYNYREEGIIVKDLDSIYVPNERANKWIKIKPEYIEGLGDDMDLIILGTLNICVWCVCGDSLRLL
jgi:DNA ligase-4